MHASKMPDAKSEIRFASEIIFDSEVCFASEIAFGSDGRIFLPV